MPQSLPALENQRTQVWSTPEQQKKMAPPGALFRL